MIEKADSNSEEEENDNDSEQFTLIQSGKYKGQFARLSQTIEPSSENPIKMTVYVVHKNGRSTKFSCVVDVEKDAVLDPHGVKPLNLDNILNCTGNDELILLRNEYLESRYQARIVKNGDILALDNKISLKSRLPAEMVSESIGLRKRKEPERLTMNFGPASQFEGRTIPGYGRIVKGPRRVQKKGKVVLEPFTEESTRSMVDSIESFEHSSDPETHRALLDQMRRDNDLIRRTWPHMTKISLHGPIYFNRNEYYALPSACVEEDEPQLSLFADAFLTIGRSVHRSTVHKVLVEQFDTAGPNSRRDPDGYSSSFYKEGFLVGKPKRVEGGYPVYFVVKDKDTKRQRVRKEYVSPQNMELLSLKPEDNDLVALVLEKCNRHKSSSESKW